MNRFERLYKPLTWLIAFMLTAFVAGCGGSTGSGSANSGASTLANSAVVMGAPAVISSNPSANDTNVPTSSNSSNNVVAAP